MGTAYTPSRCWVTEGCTGWGTLDTRLKDPRHHGFLDLMWPICLQLLSLLTTKTQAMQQPEPLGSPSDVTSVCEGMAARGRLLCSVSCPKASRLWPARALLGLLSVIDKLRPKPSGLVVSQLLQRWGLQWVVLSVKCYRATAISIKCHLLNWQRFFKFF